MPRHGRPDPTGRSSGKLSGKERSLHGPPKGKAWTWRTGEMLASVAHRSLSRHARLLLDFLECEDQNHAGRENGALLATYDQLHNWGIQRKRISEAIREAEAFGFIKCEHGGRYNMTNQPSRFRLTWLAGREGTPATNDWQKVSQADIDHWNKSRQKQNRGVKKGTTVRPPLGTTRPKLPELDANEMAEIRRLPSRSVIPHGGTASISREGEVPGADVIDHVQRPLGPIYMVASGLEKKEAADHGKVSDWGEVVTR